jgi:CBS domain-containing protein
MPRPEFYSHQIFGIFTNGIHQKWENPVLNCFDFYVSPNKEAMNFKPEMKSKEQLAAEQPTYELASKYMVKASDLITFKPDQSIEEVIDVIIEKGISGAPVLDDKRKLVGIISEKDCLRIIVDQAYYNLPSSTRKVSDYMTAKVKTLESTTDIVAAANEFLNSPVRRLPIVENGVMIGQISRRDILRASKNLKATTW